MKLDKKARKEMQKTVNRHRDVMVKVKYWMQMDTLEDYLTSLYSMRGVVRECVARRNKPQYVEQGFDEYLVGMLDIYKCILSRRKEYISSEVEKGRYLLH